MTLSYDDICKIVKTLPIPVPWSRDAFIRKISKLRRRPIVLIPVDTAALVDSPCGLWLKRDTDDLLIHASGTSDYHIDQIVCHEVGHMVLGHNQTRPDGSGGSELFRELLPDLDPATVRAVLARGEYSDAQEHEAESFASMLMVLAAERFDARSMLRSVFLRRWQ